MTIAELFVKLGIKGGDETSRKLTEVRKTISSISTVSLEAKAGILAAVYALQKLTSNGAETGTSLMQFATLTGLSIEKLQQWQWAMQQTGGSADDFQNSIENLQEKLTRMKNLGESAPMGWGDFEKSIGDLDVNKLDDTFYMMQKLQEYAKKRPPNISRILLESFGLGRGTVNALMQGVFNEKNFKAAPVYSEKQAKNLMQINAAWSNLYRRLEMITGKLNSRYGLQLIQDLGRISEQLGRLIERMIIFAGKAHVFDAISTVFKGWELIFEGINEMIDELQKKLQTPKQGETTTVDQVMKENAKTGMGPILSGLEKAVNFLTFGKFEKDINKRLMQDPSYYTYNKEKGNQAPPVTNNNVTVNQYGVKDMRDAAKEIKRELDSVKRTSPAQAGGQ